MDSDPVLRLIELATALAREDANFFETIGPGAGDMRTNSFVAELRNRAKHAYGADYSERRVGQDNGLRFDYYFPDQSTVVEVAFSLRNPQSEFERDILKTFIAQENGMQIDRLVFICKPGGEGRHQAPASQAIMRWAREKHGIDVEIHDIRELDEVGEGLI